MVGAEALLRWQHPELGMIAPSVFIDVAEQSGLIETIGPQVLRAACADAVRWQRIAHGGAAVRVGQRVAAPAAQRRPAATWSAARCANTGLPADAAAPGADRDRGDRRRDATPAALLSRLRGIGVKVWLDDFGTGFSGLSHLRRVPVDGVKIDRSFVADVLRDPDDLALTTAIIAMAHSLGITVVAEGVEKEGQYAILRERGCDLAQGYWLGHPVTAHEFRGRC